MHNLDKVSFLVIKRSDVKMDLWFPPKFIGFEGDLIQVRQSSIFFV